MVDDTGKSAVVKYNFVWCAFSPISAREKPELLYRLLCPRSKTSRMYYYVTAREM